MKIRLFVSPSEPRIPSAPPIASGTMGSVGESTATSPTLKVSTRMVGTVADPVTPRRVTGGDRSVGMPSANATMAVMAECEAPVSSTSRKGPRPLMNTGAQMRPIWSRRVGATYRGSRASTKISESASATSGTADGSGVFSSGELNASASPPAPRSNAARAAAQPMADLGVK